jgi:hypothetical protein
MGSGMGLSKRVLICCLVSTALITVSAAPASAQLDALLNGLLGGGAPAPAPPPAPAPIIVAPAPAPASAGSNPAPSTKAAKAPVVRAPFPFAIPAIKRSPPNNTDRLFAILQPLVQAGTPIERALLQVVAPFPVAGRAHFIDDWGFPRYTPVPHTHKGCDVFAAFGTPIVASDSGRVVAKGTAGAGGNSVWVQGDSGNAFYYAHLQSWARGLQVGQRVDPGTIIGYVGDTGNARGGAPHLHFELHPGGKGAPARDPKPYLDDVLKQAEVHARLLISGAKMNGNSAAARRQRVLTKLDRLFESATVKSPGDLMVFSVLEPTVGVLGLARQSAADVSGGSGKATTQQANEEIRRARVAEAVRGVHQQLAGFADAPFKDSMLALAMNLSSPQTANSDSNSDSSEYGQFGSSNGSDIGEAPVSPPTGDQQAGGAGVPAVPAPSDSVASTD